MMEFRLAMLYKGEDSNKETESACVSITADKLTEVDGGFIVANKDGTVGLEIIPRNGAKLRKVG